MTTTRVQLKDWQLGLMLVAFVVLSAGSVAGVVLWVTSREDIRQRDLAQTLVLSQIAACERGNDSRNALNVQGEILKDLTIFAANSSRELAKLATTKGQRDSNNETATKYDQAGLRIKELPLVECRAIVLNPLPVP